MIKEKIKIIKYRLNEEKRGAKRVVIKFIDNRETFIRIGQIIVYGVKALKA
jgi:hypothetical protein